MTIRITLEDPAWDYRLKVYPVRPGHYAVVLRARDGGRLEHATAIGGYTFDEILARARDLYRELVYKREANLAAGASVSAHETSLNHSAEFSARG